MAANFNPARQVAGDFYDAFMLSSRTAAWACDRRRCDKGGPAALFMALVRSLIRAYSQAALLDAVDERSR